MSETPSAESEVLVLVEGRVGRFHIEEACMTARAGLLRITQGPT